MKETVQNRLALAHNALKNGSKIEVLFEGQRLEVAQLAYDERMIRMRLTDGSLLMIEADANFGILQHDG